jgi:hypothetical protein
MKKIMDTKTHNTAELARFASGVVACLMEEGLRTRKHRAGGWNMGVEANPKWHLFRCARHANEAIAILDGVSKDTKESAHQHALRAVARAVLSAYQLSRMSILLLPLFLSSCKPSYKAEQPQELLPYSDMGAAADAGRVK